MNYKQCSVIAGLVLAALGSSVSAQDPIQTQQEQPTQNQPTSPSQELFTPPVIRQRENQPGMNRPSDVPLIPEGDSSAVNSPAEQRRIFRRQQATERREFLQTLKGKSRVERRRLTEEFDAEQLRKRQAFTEEQRRMREQQQGQ